VDRRCSSAQTLNYEPNSWPRRFSLTQLVRASALTTIDQSTIEGFGADKTGGKSSGFWTFANGRHCATFGRKTFFCFRLLTSSFCCSLEAADDWSASQLEPKSARHLVQRGG
jgi:hypothetical protein